MARRDLDRAARLKHPYYSDTPSITRRTYLRYGETQEGPLDRPSALQAAPRTRRDWLGAFLVARPPWVADNPKTSQRLLKRVLSHFSYDESPAVGTLICCVSVVGR
jgi:hypothetical protein